MVGIRPAEHDALAISEIQATDREGDSGSIRSEIAIERAGGAAGYWAGEIQLRYGNAGTLKFGQASGQSVSYQVRERDRLRGSGAISPLLPGIGNIQRSNGGPGIVREENSPEQTSDGGVSGSQRAESPVGGCPSPVRIKISGVTAAIIRYDRRPGASAGVIPARESAVVRPSGAAAGGKRIEVLRYGGGESGNADLRLRPLPAP